MTNKEEECHFIQYACMHICTYACIYVCVRTYIRMHQRCNRATSIDPDDPLIHWLRLGDLDNDPGKTLHFYTSC